MTRYIAWMASGLFLVAHVAPGMPKASWSLSPPRWIILLSQLTPYALREPGGKV